MQIYRTVFKKSEFLSWYVFLATPCTLIKTNTLPLSQAATYGGWLADYNTVFWTGILQTYKKPLSVEICR